MLLINFIPLHCSHADYLQEMIGWESENMKKRLLDALS